MGEQLEDALAEAEAELAAAAKTVAALTAELRKGRAKATTGELRDLRKALQNVAELGAAVQTEPPRSPGCGGSTTRSIWPRARGGRRCYAMPRARACRSSSRRIGSSATRCW